MIASCGFVSKQYHKYSELPFFSLKGVWLSGSETDVTQDRNHLQSKEKEKKTRILKKEGLRFRDRTK